jgi:hypothetical protein
MNRLALLKDREAALASMGKSLSAVDRIALERSTDAMWMNDIAAMTPYALSVFDYGGEGLRTLNEMDRIASAIDYLRFVEGEKHLILHRRTRDVPAASGGRHEHRRLGEPGAGDAECDPDRRTDPTQAPMSAYETLRPQGSGNAGAVAAATSAVGPEPMVARFVAGSIRSLAELTGGMASVYDYADKSLSKIAQATSSGICSAITRRTRPSTDGSGA